MTKPESITIKNEKGRLSQEEIKRMLRPSSLPPLMELNTKHKRIRSQDCDGGKISKDDKKTSALSSKEKLTEAQSVVNPIASKAPATYDWQS
ncbi:hypothetical protein JOM56_006922 [Amanita muscaria]